MHPTLNPFIELASFVEILVLYLEELVPGLRQISIEQISFRGVYRNIGGGGAGLDFVLFPGGSPPVVVMETNDLNSLIRGGELSHSWPRLPLYTPLISVLFIKIPSEPGTKA